MQSSRKPFFILRKPNWTMIFLLLGLWKGMGTSARADEPAQPDNFRSSTTDADLKYWLQNMVWYHRYSIEEITQATGLGPQAAEAALIKFDISPATRPLPPKQRPLLVLPYPGGRHPRIGFLDGAVRPQRETKFSLFTPWDPESYVVVDLPEAIWSNLGLTYLAHTHIPTVWSKQGIEMEKLEWNRHDDGSLDHQRKLPNGIIFSARVQPEKEGVRLGMALTNGSSEPLSDLRVQVCSMLKGLKGFDLQTNDNKIFRPPYAACRSEDGKRWLIMAFEPLHRVWGNPPCPCLHADPKFPDCAPGETVKVNGWISFYEGAAIEEELTRLEKTDWRKGPGEAAKKIGLFQIEQGIRGRIEDADTGELLAARVYIQAENGQWFFPSKGDLRGSVVEYRRHRRGLDRSIEMHTCVSAHPWIAELPDGKYQITIERGKEYLPLKKEIVIDGKPLEVNFPLQRWVDLAQQGWYSGDTHVHRGVDELATAMQAEDLNVALPLTHWVREAGAVPEKNQLEDPNPEEGKVVQVDATRAYYTRNTEYELFTVNGKPHTLGAFFVLNHRRLCSLGAPPVAEIARNAHEDGALIELDKHNWPWSMAMVPVMPVDLFELSNNHIWRTEFGFPNFGEAAAEYMKIERDEKGFTEEGWIEFGFQNYYALLDCGFRLRPTAGTASGVHPVPLGFGRVYVQLEGPFHYEAWMQGLNQGRSFVTTGPILLATLENNPPGSHIEQAEPSKKNYSLSASALSTTPLDKIQIVVNGRVVDQLTPENKPRPKGGFESKINPIVTIESSSWVAVRCYEKHSNGRVRFAHSSPIFVDIPGKPLRPRREEVEYLMKRVQDQIDRSGEILPPEAINEYRQALKAYEKIGETAQD